VIQSSEQALGLTIITEACLIGGELNTETSSFKVPTILIAKEGRVDEYETIDVRQLLTIGIK
jgi:hypothetical protein